MYVSKFITILVQNPKNYPIAVSSVKASPLSFTFSYKFCVQLVVTVQFSSAAQSCPTLWHKSEYVYVFVPVCIGSGGLPRWC